MRSGLRAVARLAPIGVLVLLTACANIVDKPVRASLYDLGPIAPPDTTQAQPLAPPLVVPELRSASALQGTDILYRLAYADRHELRPYAESRWSAPVPELVHERLLAQLARDRSVLSPGQVTAVARSDAGAPQVLRLELQEFFQRFDAPGRSHGQLRLLATLLQSGPTGDRLVDQRAFSVTRPAATADAPGGVRALAEAVDEAAVQIRHWLRQATG